MSTKTIAGQNITEHFFNTIVVGAGAAGMNCAKKLYEYMDQKGVDQPEKRIAVVTAGLPLGASRMSGSDKQTYYKMGTNPDIADSAASFAKSNCLHYSSSINPLFMVFKYLLLDFRQFAI